MGRADMQTNWSENRKHKGIPQFTDMLIEIIKMFNNVTVPDDPNTTMPQRKQQSVVGTLTHKVRQLTWEREGKLEEFNMVCRKEWERRGVSGEAATGQILQDLGKQKLDKIWIKKRITYSAYYDEDREGKDKKLRWVGGLILDVSFELGLCRVRGRVVTRKTRRLMFCGMRFRRRIALCASQLSLSKNISLTRHVRERGRKRMK